MGTAGHTSSTQRANWLGWVRPLLFVFTAFALFATACGGNDSFSETSSGTATDAGGDFAAPAIAEEAPADFADDAAAPEPERTVAGEGAAGNVSDVLGSGGVDATQLQPIDIGRDIIYTASVEVAVLDVAAAGTEAAQIISGLGGLLFGQSSTSSPNPRSVLTFKVRPEDFQTALTQLGGIGELRNQNVNADDVTERVVDLQSRITTAAASTERLRALLDDAPTVQTIVELERQLLERETDLETLRGQLRTIQDRVDLATITLTIVESLNQPELALTASVYPGHDQGTSCGGARGMTLDEGEDITFCFEIQNVGDTPLTDLNLVDPVIGITNIDELTLIFGDLEAPLETGDFVSLAFETTLDKTVGTRSRASAQPVDNDGASISGPISTTDVIRVTAIEPEGLPSFMDALTGSLSVLATIFWLLVLTAGALLPFIWLVPVGWFGWRWVKGRREKNRAKRLIQMADEHAANQPPPPSAAAAGATPPAGPGDAAHGAEDLIGTGGE